MTPENKKRFQELMDRVKFRLIKDVERDELYFLSHELMSALEETQQQLTLERERTDYWGEKELEVRKKLAEAQQTIARHEKALNEIIVYSTDENAVDVASVSMGYEKGDKTNG